MSESLPETAMEAPQGALPTLDTGESGGWRDRKLAIAFWTVLLLLLFRPLFWHDIQTIANPPVSEEGTLEITRPTAILNFAVDLFCFALTLGTVITLVAGRIGSIAYNTFREAVRNRILYFILFFALILLGASGVVKELAIAAHNRVVTNLGLASISFFGLMAAVFAGISLVYNELEKKTIYTIVSKPIHRYQFLLGKFFGLLLTIYVIIAIMTFFFFLVFNYQANTTDDLIHQVLITQAADGSMELVENPHVTKTLFLLKAVGKSAGQAVGNLFGFASAVVTPALLTAVVMICLELMIVTAIAIFFSSFTTPTLSAVFTVLIFLAGRLNEDIMRFGERVIQEALKRGQVTSIGDLALTAQVKVYFARAAALLVPNLDSLNITSQVLYAETVQVWRYSVLYALSYTAMVLIVATMIFQKRNFK